MSPLLFLALLSDSVICADIVEGTLRNVLLSIRGVGERVLSNIAIPTSKDLVNNPVFGFQVDDKSAYAIKSFGELLFRSLSNDESGILPRLLTSYIHGKGIFGSDCTFLNTCPPALPPPPLTGTWFVTYASKKWLQTTLADLDEVIDLLANNQNVPASRPLSTIFRPDVSVSCLKFEFTTQSNEVRSPFEISYMKNNKKSSLIGELARLPDKSLHMVFVPSLSTYMIVVYTTATVNETPLDVMVLSETSAFPKCENFVVLQRSLQSSRIFQIISAMGANFPSNPLQEIQCDQNGEGKTVIRPL